MALSNAERQRRFKARKRREGMQRLPLYATPEQAEHIRAYLQGGVLPVTRPRVRVHARLPARPVVNGAATPPPKPGKGRRRKRRPVDPVAENNREIFEAHQSEIRRRLATGKKPSAIAAWLNTLGFVGTGATLNWFLK